MTSNWWSSDPTERFWLETTDRTDLGGDLWTHQKNDSGGTSWSRRLVSNVVPGDIVLHWNMPLGSMTGWSRVDRVPYEDVDVSGRPIFVAPLARLQSLSPTVTLADLRAVETEIWRVREAIQDRVDGPLYFPFELSQKRPLRPFQGYLTKFPKALLSVVPGLRRFEQLAVASPEIKDSAESPMADTRPARRSLGRAVDPAKRRAIEAHAVAIAEHHYRQAKYVVKNVGATEPWDLTAKRGTIELHIEVKGSTMPRDAVDLTDGEVRHAETHSTNVLVVVDSIRIDANLRCSGGRIRIWPDWMPDRAALVPTAYRYMLPTGGTM